MSRHDRQRLEDISAAINAVSAHLRRGDLSDGLVFDAVRFRLIEIGEAVKALPARSLASENEIPWANIARLRDLLAHRYFDTSHAILQATVDRDLPALKQAIVRLLEEAEGDDSWRERRCAHGGFAHGGFAHGGFAQGFTPRRTMGSGSGARWFAR